MKLKTVQVIVESGNKKAILSGYNKFVEAEQEKPNAFTAEFFELETAYGTRYQARLTAVGVAGVWALSKTVSAINYILGCIGSDKDTFVTVIQK